MTERAKGRARGRWDDPIGPLQAARFAKHETLERAAEGIGALCPGHVRGGVRRDCEMRGGLLNDYERGARRPSVDHIQALCDYYRASAEDLGLVKVTWAGADSPDAAAPPSDGAVGTIQTNAGY